MHTDTLCEIVECLRKKIPATETIRYYIPSLWLEPNNKPNTIKINPFRFVYRQIRHILRRPSMASKVNANTAIFYNILLDMTTAFDHNDNGILDTPVNADGMRESGTILKSIALLPYLKYLGTNAVCLSTHSLLVESNTLPLTRLQLNPFLNEPALEFDIEKQFTAFVEALHYMGMKLVVKLHISNNSSALTNIVELYQRQFSIDGVIFPENTTKKLLKEVMTRARQQNPQFLCWHSDLSVGTLQPNKACCQFSGKQQLQTLQQKISQAIQSQGFVAPTSQSLCTSLPGEIRIAKLCWAIDSFISTIPFIHDGFELGEISCVNNGFAFPGKLQEYTAGTNSRCYNWLSENSIIPWLHKIAKIRRKYQKLIANESPATFQYIKTKSPEVIAFVRCHPSHKPVLCIIANLNCFQRRQTTIMINTRKKQVLDLLGRRSISIHQGKLSLTLSRGSCVVLAI